MTIGQAFDLAYKKFLESGGKDVETRKQIAGLQKRVSVIYSLPKIDSCILYILNNNSEDLLVDFYMATPHKTFQIASKKITFILTDSRS